MSNIIIPSSVDETKVLAPIEFPLKADADMVQDANSRLVATIDSSIATGESIKLAKLLAQAPSMFELLGDLYVILSMVAKANDLDHGTETEDKENCPLCRCEQILRAL